MRHIMTFILQNYTLSACLGRIKAEGRGIFDSFCHIQEVICNGG